MSKSNTKQIIHPQYSPGVLILATVLVLSSCNGLNIFSSDGNEPDTSRLIIYEDYDEFLTILENLVLDPINIDSVAIQNDSLMLIVSYVGGCEEHTFKLISSAALMYSLPPQMSLYLGHKAHGDACETFINRKLLFGLSPVEERYGRPKRDEVATIILRINTTERNVPDAAVLYEY